MRHTLFATAVLLTFVPALAQAQDQPAPSERAEARQKVRMACAADVQKFCANIERAKGAMRACLEQNQANLSADCNSARADRAALRAKEKG